MRDIAFSLLENQETACFAFQLLSLHIAVSSSSEEAQWRIGYGVGLRIKWSSVRIRPWPLRWVLGQGSLLPLSQGEAFTLASISYLAILVKYILAKKTWQGHRKLQWATSKDEPLLSRSNCPLETAEPSRNNARVPGYKKKDKKKTRKEQKNERRRNRYARVRRCKVTSTLGLLIRGDTQEEGLRGLQPRARWSKLDYFYAGITSPRLHWRHGCRIENEARGSSAN